MHIGERKELPNTMSIPGWGFENGDTDFETHRVVLPIGAVSEGGRAQRYARVRLPPDTCRVAGRQRRRRLSARVPAENAAIPPAFGVGIASVPVVAG